MVLRLAEMPWGMRDVMEQIWIVLDKLHFQIRHIYREANVIADFLASFAVQTGRCHEFSENDVLPFDGRLLL
ncbi:unnamed protein product [Ilex paraguariensis]|uniref:RNase H type-1 domain-containing protein n=1 Tax=Ilex paraguariensis TaxID=185542 RepID=A0ABC8QRE2_9AQUA